MEGFGLGGPGDEGGDGGDRGGGVEGQVEGVVIRAMDMPLARTDQEME